jgi:hypothetical protein
MGNYFFRRPVRVIFQGDRELENLQRKFLQFDKLLNSYKIIRTN